MCANVGWSVQRMEQSVCSRRPSLAQLLRHRHVRGNSYDMTRHVTSPWWPRPVRSCRMYAAMHSIFRNKRERERERERARQRNRVCNIRCMATSRANDAAWSDSESGIASSRLRLLGSESQIADWWPVALHQSQLGTKEHAILGNLTAGTCKSSCKLHTVTNNVSPANTVPALWRRYEKPF